MDTTKIAITGWGSISPLGVDGEVAWKRYQDNKHCFIRADFPAGSDWVAPLSADGIMAAGRLAEENSKYRQLDPSVWYAMVASRNAVQQAGWKNATEAGINIGSSRGATIAFEKYHSEFLQSGGRFAEPLASPTTTLGNIASWTAADLQSRGPAISHSITCSTALHAVINAVAWLRAGLCTRFIAGGSEASLTPFTLAQMKALKVYSSLDDPYPCRSMDPGKNRNTMILGEGAASFCLEADTVVGLVPSGRPDVPDTSDIPGDAGFSRIRAYITGIGYGTEAIEHGASLSADGQCLQRSMKMALEGHDPATVDVAVLHVPGTRRGDSAELSAIDAIFGAQKPLVTSNKWKIGHTFGASGALSLEFALLMLQHDRFIGVPYLPAQQQKKALKKILVNGVGFGGNAASILLERP